ncbi:MAG: hypothetical protein WC742_14035 [Gallionellaceae bacterium]|jgi:ABC-type transporter Mla maintaining outer membrane lipid asymmetry ATPase subunit MlaF
MTGLFKFTEVHLENSGRILSFVLSSGETQLLQLSAKVEKDEVLNLATGVVDCESGLIEIILGERRRENRKKLGAQGERRKGDSRPPAEWQALRDSRPGRVGWVAGSGGLISNLKIWENVTLPLWYHASHEEAETEKNMIYWLNLLGVEENTFAELMAALPHNLEPWQRKLAGLLRALLQMPRVLIVDALLFEDVKARIAQKWIAALDAYVSQGRAVLVVSDKATTLPWKKIE